MTSDDGNERRRTILAGLREPEMMPSNSRDKSLCVSDKQPGLHIMIVACEVELGRWPIFSTLKKRLKSKRVNIADSQTEVSKNPTDSVFSGSCQIRLDISYDRCVAYQTHRSYLIFLRGIRSPRFSQPLRSNSFMTRVSREL